MQELSTRFPTLIPWLTFLALMAAAWALFFVCRRYLLKLIRALTASLPGLWAKTVLDSRFLAQLSWLIPIGAVMLSASQIGGLPAVAVTLIERLCQATLVVLVLRAITVLLGTIHTAYLTLEVARDRPIKGFIQVALLILHLLAAILVVSILLDKSPWVFISGLGAMTAILLLIFRDTLLSLVAGFQLTSNQLVRVGDWIEMPQFGADGFIIDIALHAVRVQNWDKTITVIPTHKFLEHSFKNWRGMQESGGRRIKRAIRIDMSTIRFLTDEEIRRFERFVLLKDYLKGKLDELRQFNVAYADQPNLIVNARRLTNVGTFRAYVTQYLRSHPRISQEMTFLVRQLDPGPEGLPLEIYVFVNDVRWAVYEGVQADIFDHLLSILPEFGLRVFQSPSGYDFRSGLKGVRSQALPSGGPALFDGGAVATD